MEPEAQEAVELPPPTGDDLLAELRETAPEPPPFSERVTLKLTLDQASFLFEKLYRVSMRDHRRYSPETLKKPAVTVPSKVFAQFNQAMLFLHRHLNVRSEIRGVNRYDIDEIPFEALREAVVNALMHRDYSITGTQVSVEVYDDRVEIVNPGSLAKELSPKTLGAISIRRNELISDLFFRLDKVERVGQGIQNMKDAMRAAGLREPEFAADGFFRATFHRSPEFSLKGSEKRWSEKVVRADEETSRGV